MSDKEYERIDEQDAYYDMGLESEYCDRSPDCDCPRCSRNCWHCGGEGAGIVGSDWDSDDPINGPYDGDVEDCPCCGGSGRAKDCTFW